MNHRTVCVLIVLTGLCSAKGVRAQTAAWSDSTLHARPPSAPAARLSLWFWSSPFDTIGGPEYFMRHSFSLDNYLEGQPGYLVERMGPIGAPSSFSRYGIGSGRGALYIGDVLVNDPQDGRVPLGLVPTTAVGELVLGGAADGWARGAANIEGVVQIREPVPNANTPLTFIELSKGNRELKQRRVRFSSSSGPVGIDLAYDGLRDDGYAFDARGLVDGPDFGRSATRVQSGGLRGVLPDGMGSYSFSFRQFSSSFTGDLSNADNELRRNGDIGVLNATLPRVHIALYERTHRATAVDSLTRNQTTGATVRVPLFSGEAGEAGVSASYEDILSSQDVGGSTTNDRTQTASAALSGQWSLPGSFMARYAAAAARQFDGAGSWGGSFGVARRLSARLSALLTLDRRYRLPTLGELFLPQHAAGTGVVVGNRETKAEHSLEIGARLFATWGPVEMETRGTAIRVEDPIRFAADLVSPSTVRPTNAAAEDVRIVESRMRLATHYRQIAVTWGGGVEYADGERTGFFAAVPGFRATSSVSLERSFFKNSSALRLTGEFQHTGKRDVRGGTELASYDVFNVKIDARLIDAQLYLLLLNVLGERYETASPFLMTPRTFVYGIEWNLFN
jgi:hypothetical protein